MTRAQVNELLGIRNIRRLSEHSTVVEFVSGHCRPATELEQRMYGVLGCAVDGVPRKP
jgi:hypothetical protein